jgi:hypothetical protein
MKTRIIERTWEKGKKQYVIQMKPFWFWCGWTKARETKGYCKDTFDTFEEAMEYIGLIDGTLPIEKVVFER